MIKKNVGHVQNIIKRNRCYKSIQSIHEKDFAKTVVWNFCDSTRRFRGLSYSKCNLKTLHEKLTARLNQYFSTTFLKMVVI